MSEAVRQDRRVVRQPYKGGEGSEFISVRALGPFPRIHARIDSQTADELRMLAKSGYCSISDDWRYTAILVYAFAYQSIVPGKFSELVEDVGHERAVTIAAARTIGVMKDEPEFRALVINIIWRWFTSRKMQRH